MIASLILAIKSQESNKIEAIKNLAWLYFFIHLLFVLTYSIVTEYKMNDKLCTIPIFLVNILYQVTVFYSISSYATIFNLNKDAAINEGHAELSNRILSPFYMNNIIQFWIVAEITLFVASIVSIVIILAM
jgi:hypothetical protein